MTPLPCPLLELIGRLMREEKERHLAIEELIENYRKALQTADEFLNDIGQKDAEIAQLKAENLRLRELMSGKMLVITRGGG